VTDLAVDTADRGGAYPQPRVLLAQAGAKRFRRADHRGGDGSQVAQAGEV